MPRKEWRIGDPMINETDFWPDEAYHAEDKEKEKLVLKLATLITDRYIKHPLEAVSVGDVVDVKVLGVDMQKKRISLSMKL